VEFLIFHIFASEKATENTMARIAQLAPSTEGGKQLLWDYLNYKTTGFKPWVTKGLGGTDHWRSRVIYQEASRSAFRSQAKKAAQEAMHLLPAADIPIDIGVGIVVQDAAVEKEAAGAQKDDVEEDDLFPSDDDDYSSSGKEDETLDDTFDDIADEEMLNLRKPYVLEYPNGNKLCIVFPLDGDVEDKTSNQLEFSRDNKTLVRWRRVPECRKNAEMMLNGVVSQKDADVHPGFGFSDADLVILDAVIHERMQNCTADRNGDVWEARESIILPFACIPTLFSKHGKKMTSYKVKKNKSGFTWCYFWLVGMHVINASGFKHHSAAPKKRFGGTRVHIGSDSAEYIYEPASQLFKDEVK
jgi:hypothetical protein